MEFLDFSEYSDPPLLTSVTTHRSLEQNRGVNDMVGASEKLRSCLANMLECFSNFFMTGTFFWGLDTFVDPEGRLSRVRHSPVYRHLGSTAVSEFDFGSRYSMAMPK